MFKTTGPGGLPAPTAVRVDGCTSRPCHINQGDSISYEVDFNASKLTFIEYQRVNS